MATREHADSLVPRIFRAARRAGIADPDWAAGPAPRDCRLARPDYLALLRDRATGSSISEEPGGRLIVRRPAGSTVTIWTGALHQTHSDPDDHGFSYPGDATSSGAAVVFTRRGDYHAHGWPAVYNGIGR